MFCDSFATWRKAASCAGCEGVDEPAVHRAPVEGERTRPGALAPQLKRTQRGSAQVGAERAMASSITRPKVLMRPGNTNESAARQTVAGCSGGSRPAAG